MGMTVQELIDELMKVDDKSKEIIVINDTSDTHLEALIDDVVEATTSIFIHATNYN